MSWDDGPLELSILKERLSEETYQWLIEDEEKQNQWKREKEEEGPTIDLFGTGEDDGEEHCNRVETWTSSRNNPDGFGGIYRHDESTTDIQQPTNEEEERGGSGGVTVYFIVSDASGGHGDSVWAASRHVSNLLAYPETCAELLGYKFVEGDGHPLNGRKFVELGAGAGLPSWTALKCGASLVVCTDQRIPDRIRCLAEAAQRNFFSKGTNSDTNMFVAPYVWGGNIPNVLKKNECDVVVAADCLYMPHFHNDLLLSIQNMIKPGGVALLPFAIHNTTKNDDDIWAIQLLAAEKYGFATERLSSCQLTPQAQNMHSKRALVHMLRLTKT